MFKRYDIFSGYYQEIIRIVGGCVTGGRVRRPPTHPPVVPSPSGHADVSLGKTFNPKLPPAALPSV